jgi:phage terminase large subunit
MATLNFNDLFPEANDGTRGPLPKQLELFNKTLDPNGPKYIAYITGIGGGKTLSGCITMLAMAVMHAGDYLIGRQYSPELKVTTYKQFMEICPPELILEHRVADMMVKLKAVNGASNVYFRPLEDWDKFRSMNLSGFMIDECNQVSEEAFMLLQGRLRGRGLRKGILVSNPAGHDWAYRWFFKKDHLKTDEAKKNYYLIRGSSLENIHLPNGYIDTLMQSWSDDRIQREIMGSFDAFEGAVYEEFRRDIHVIKPFKIPENWPRHLRIDHGYRNPAAALFFAIGPDGEAYLYREFYQTEWLINEIVQGKKDPGVGHLPGLVQMGRGETFETAKIDPSTKNRRGATGESDYDEYRRNWPTEWPVLGLAKNDVQVGIDRVKSYLKVHPRLQKPMLYIFDTCTNVLEEITQYRYPELRANQEGKKAEHEKPLKVNDHAMDALRYMIVDLPDPFKEAPDDIYKRIKYNSLEGALIRDLGEYKKPKQKDPFGF